MTRKQIAKKLIDELTLSKLRELLRGPLADVDCKESNGKCPLARAFAHLGVDGLVDGEAFEFESQSEVDSRLMLTHEQQEFVGEFDHAYATLFGHFYEGFNGEQAQPPDHVRPHLLGLKGRDVAEMADLFGGAE